MILNYFVVEDLNFVNVKKCEKETWKMCSVLFRVNRKTTNKLKVAMGVIGGNRFTMANRGCALIEDEYTKCDAYIL